MGSSTDHGRSVGGALRAHVLLASLLVLACSSLVATSVARADSLQSQTFAPLSDCTDYFQYFTVPPDVNWITAEVIGGAGGFNGNTGRGGRGGYVTAPIPVEPNEQLAIDVGRWGNTSSDGGCGWAHGGERGYAKGGDSKGKDGFGGGSGSIVFRYKGPGAIDPLLVAGGGGGGGGNGADGGGDGADAAATPGAGVKGSGAGGGSGGQSSNRTGHNGTPGSDENVGRGGAGGGGGGGYPDAGEGGYGGTWGGGGGGGAGGTWAADGLIAQLSTSFRPCEYPGGADTCNGLVTISWDITPAQVAVDGGDGQQRPAGSVFPQRLSALVNNAEGTPVEGAIVTFTLPGFGAAGTFTSGNSTTATAVSGADGVASSPVLEANGNAGSWLATATSPGASTATFHLANLKAATVTHVAPSASTPNPSVAGEPVIFNAQVATTGTTPYANWSGSVQFLLDDAPLGDPVSVNADGVATSPSVRLGIDGSNVGDHTVQALYEGDRNHTGSQSSVLTQTVTAATTATTITSSPRVATTGEPVTLTAQVIPQAAAGDATPPGNVGFMVVRTSDGATVLSQPNVGLDADGRASVVTPALSSDGQYAVSVVYAGTPSFKASTGTMTEYVGPDATGTLVTSSVNPSVYGQAFTLTATVARSGAGVAPTGNVTFTSDGTTLCPTAPVMEDDDATDGDGVAVCRVPGGLTAKANPVTVAFVDPSGGYRPSTGSLTQQVTAAATTTTVDATPTIGVFGSTAQVRARVTPVAPGAGVPSGTVQFSVDDLAVGLPVDVVRGVALSAPMSGLTVGAHRLTASFEDDTDPADMRSSSGALTYRVQRATTTLEVRSDAEPSPAEQPVVLTAYAAAGGNAGPVSGDVQFLLDGAAYGDPVPLRAGVARTAPRTLSPGTHTIVAELQGGTQFAPALATFTQHVAAALPLPPVTPSTPGLTPAEAAAAAAAERPRVSLETERVEAGPTGIVNVVLGCRAAAGDRCTGRVNLASRTRLPARLVGAAGARGWKAAGLAFGTRTYSVGAGELRAVQVQLTHAAARVLADQGGVRLTATAEASAGDPGATRALRVTAPRAPTLWISRATVTASANGAVPVRVQCPAWASCSGRIVLIRAGRTVASARLAAVGGGPRTVKLWLDVRAWRALAAAGRQRLTVQATTTLPAGLPKTTRRTVAVAAPAEATR